MKSAAWPLPISPSVTGTALWMPTIPAFTGADPSLGSALLTARQFVEEYPVETAGKGLLFTGTPWRG